MFDTHAVARTLTDADFTPAQADAITNAVRQAAEHGDPVTSDQFKAGLSEVRAEIASQVANLDARLSTQVASLDTRLSTQIAEVRADVAEQHAVMRADVADLRTEVRTEIAGVRTEIATLETRLIRWVVGTVITTATLTVGILRLVG